VLSERPLGYFQPYAVVSALIAALSQTDLILLLVLLIYCFYPSACHTAAETFAEKLIAPFWHRVRRRRPALVAVLCDGNLSISQWFCATAQNERCRRPCRSMQVSHNRAPPLPLSYSVY
jgi:hypothetical protein